MRPLYTLPLPGAVYNKLQEAGFSYCEELWDSKQDIREEVAELLKCFGDSWKNVAELISPPPTQTALDLLNVEKDADSIVTFCQVLDEVLGGGIPLGSVTELCGPPGSGKTQLCLQLCIDVQVPRCLGGLAAEAIYIDTDSGFSFHRLTDIAEACRSHCIKIATVHSSLPMAEVNAFQVTSMLEGIHYMATQDHVQLLAAVCLLNAFIRQHKQVKLVVIDSLVFPFYAVSDSLVRTRQVLNIISQLYSLAVEFNVAVVVTNQLTTRITGIRSTELVPALGESLAHQVNQRLMLGSLKHSSHRTAVIFKSPSLPHASASFQSVNNTQKTVLDSKTELKQTAMSPWTWLSQQDGSVEELNGGFIRLLLNNKDLYGEIFIGHPPQKFKVTIDTTSPDFWVRSQKCPWFDYTCWWHNKYDSRKSKSYKKNSTEFKHHYDLGTVQGFLSSDTLWISWAHVADQMFGEVTHHSGSVPQTRFDGALGLGLPTGDITPPLYSMFAQGLISEPLVSIYLSRDIHKDSEVMFGSYNRNHCFSTFSFYPVMEGSQNWEIEMPLVYMREEGFYESNHSAIFDTSSSLIIGPAETVDQLNICLGGRPLHGTHGLYQLDCKIKDSGHPTVSFTFGKGSSQRDYNLEPQDYTIKVTLSP